MQTGYQSDFSIGCEDRGGRRSEGRGGRGSEDRRGRCSEDRRGRGYQVSCCSKLCLRGSDWNRPVSVMEKLSLCVCARVFVCVFVCVLEAVVDPLGASLRGTEG